MNSKGVKIDPHALRRLRWQLDMTIEEFAQHVGVGTASVARYERGVGRPYPSKLALIEKACGKSAVIKLIPDDDERNWYVTHTARRKVIPRVLKLSKRSS